MEMLKSISPRLKFTRKTAKSAGDIPPDVWGDVNILYTSNILPEPEAAPRLRWVQSHNAGVEALLAQPLMASGNVVLTSASGIHATTMAEYTFAMMLALARKIPALLRYQAKAEWPADRFSVFLPRELRGATVGIVGYGSLGREIGRIAQAFGMEVLATKHDVMHPAAKNEYTLPDTGDPQGTLVSRLYPPEATRSMVTLCDFVVICAPLTPRTAGLINADVLSAMKRSAYLINVARGGLIDEEALIAALRDRKIAGAALDVFTQEPLPASSPLWELDNLIISPHISGNTSHYNESAAEVFAENLDRYLNHRDLLNLVDRTRGY